MTTPPKTELIIVADCSGSMEHLKTEGEQAARKLVRDQQAVPGEARLTLVRFNSVVQTLFSGMPLAQVKDGDIELRAEGVTALYDAVGRTLETEGQRIATDKWADLVIVAILTDGQENASRSYNQSRIKEMVQHAEANGWKFIFMAANQDAWLAASAIGTQTKAVAQYAATPAGMRQAYAVTGQSMYDLRTGVTK